MLGISTKTIQYRRNKLNIPDDLTYTVISDQELDNVLRTLRLQQPNSEQQLLMINKN